MDWNPDRLQQWLNERLENISEIEITDIVSGHSNENFAIDGKDIHWFLRKSPVVMAHQSAHNVLREYRIMRTLESAQVRVPKMIIHCDDRSILGTPFYLMERVTGCTLSMQLPALYSFVENSSQAVAEEVIDTLIELHKVNWQQLGLGNIGSVENFLSRQTERWIRQAGTIFEKEQDQVQWDAVHSIARWLVEHMPEIQNSPTLIHGDYQLDNLLFCEQPPARLLAIVDWEFATLGDPLLDLASLLISWPQRTGYSDQAYLAERYCAKSGRDISALNYYKVLAGWKRAIVLQSRRQMTASSPELRGQVAHFLRKADNDTRL